jgi:hypothetical protein
MALSGLAKIIEVHAGGDAEAMRSTCAEYLALTTLERFVSQIRCTVDRLALILSQQIIEGVEKPISEASWECPIEVDWALFMSNFVFFDREISAKFTYEFNRVLGPNFHKRYVLNCTFETNDKLPRGRVKFALAPN